MASRSTKRSRTAAPPPLHELESEVMEQLWAGGEASVRSVMEALNARARKERAYTTYMTIMARLHKKGLLNRRREGKTDYYAPAYERDEYMALRAKNVALSHFAEQMARLDPARRRALQRLARKA
jgi:predicted transcriptional regulator